MDNGRIKENIFKIVSGSIIAILITLVLLFLFSIILTYTNIQETIITPVIIVISAFSILIGSSISTIKIKKNGLLNGMIVGLLYILSIYLLSGITGAGFSLNLTSFIMIVVSIIAGMVGGVIGINLFL